MNKYTFMGNGRNKDFYFTFPFFSKGDIVVEINSVPATGYGVFCIQGTNSNDFPFTGGRIHFATAPKTTDIVTIERKLQFNRLIDYQTTSSLDPITINQDMNYFFELLKDMKSSLQGFEDTYAEFTDTESSQALLSKINEVLSEIDDLGDITTLRTNVTNLGTSISNLSESLNTLSGTVGTHTTNIDTVDTRTTGLFDYVIETQTPTSSNNYTWYRKYKNGWVEQGGIAQAAGGGWSYVNLPIEMANTKATVNVSVNWSTTGQDGLKIPTYYMPSTTKIGILIHGRTGQSGVAFYSGEMSWQVSGMAAA